jgi:hypothetical protein
MAFDTKSGRLIAFGGCTAHQCGAPGITKNKTYAWDGTNWTDLGLDATAPQPRSSFALASTGSRIVVFGGADATYAPLGDTWVLSAGAWKQAQLPAWQSGVSVTDYAHDQILVIEGTTTHVRSRDGWSDVAGGPSPRSGLGVAFDPAGHDVLLFGGNAGPVQNDTWTWDGSAWTQLHPTQAPDPRFGMVLGWDGKHVTLFGGVAPGHPTGFTDTWSWNGSNWVPASPAHSPPGTPSFTCGGSDLARGNLVMVASDLKTYTYDGVDWTAHDVAPPRNCTNFVWSAARQRLVMTSGTEVWEWDGSTWSLQGTTTIPPLIAPLTATTDFDGGILLPANLLDALHNPTTAVQWELRWDGPGSRERCDGSDQDADHLDRCADGDCWTVCTPECPPGTSCVVGAPRCGDGTCDAVHEDCHSCPADCTCVPVCGDFVCDPNETCAGDCP